MKHLQRVVSLACPTKPDAKKVDQFVHQTDVAMSDCMPYKHEELDFLEVSTHASKLRVSNGLLSGVNSIPCRFHHIPSVNFLQNGMEVSGVYVLHILLAVLWRQSRDVHGGRDMAIPDEAGVETSQDPTGPALSEERLHKMKLGIIPRDAIPLPNADIVQKSCHGIGSTWSLEMGSHNGQDEILENMKEGRRRNHPSATVICPACVVLMGLEPSDKRRRLLITLDNP